MDDTGGREAWCTALRVLYAMHATVLLLAITWPVHGAAHRSMLDAYDLYDHDLYAALCIRVFPSTSTAIEIRGLQIVINKISFSQ